MRALTHITGQSAPDYALRVPGHLQLLTAAGILAGLVGAGLLLGAPALPMVVGLVLLAAGIVGLTFAVAIGVITSPRLRTRARHQMLDSFTWRGDEHVLDVGCGNGFLLNEIAKQLTTGHATGIDLWKTEAGTQAAETAWRNARLEGVADRVDIKNADARTMPFGDGEFDVVVSSLMLHHAGGSVDRERVLSEMLRVLKPGGALMLYDVAPLIGGAARSLRARGTEAIEQSGRVMALLSVRRPVAAQL